MIAHLCVGAMAWWRGITLIVAELGTNADPFMLYL